MSHRIHPKIHQIRGIKDWLSRGFYQNRFPQYLREDFEIRRFLNKTLKNASVENIEIERTPTILKVIIKTARPALVIGRGGKGVEELKKSLDSIFNKTRIDSDKAQSEIKIEILEIKNPWQSAQLISQWIASQIEKKVPYRRVLKMALSKVKDQKEIKGVRVQVAGRLNGIEISRTEWLGKGRLPRQTIRSKIDYGFVEANCAYGVVSAKTWLYKGEEFD